MPSPFPGMDPYLEDPRWWPDFHDRFINSWSEVISEQLPAGYDACIQERVCLDPGRETFIEIRTLPEREVIAALELLSPSNKLGRTRVEYLDKRDEVLRAPVHLVELDLLLGGLRLPMGAPLPSGDYYAFVSRAQNRPDCSVYCWQLPDPLPPIPIPLRAPDADIGVSLKAALDLAYARGRFDRRLKYSQPTVVPMPKAHRQCRAIAFEKFGIC
ncbi:MAG TPA: DUF4058 family protein [Tepidisphaeraceae bacterium]|nr:DUF4058 family protein [Tepidisphaeraceae bacterium]